MKREVLFIVLLLVGLVSASGVGTSVNVDDGLDVIVVVQEDIPGIVHKYDIDKKHEFFSFDGFSGKVPVDKVEKLIKDKKVKDVYLNQEFYLSLDSSVPQIGADYVYNFGYDGSGQTVCVLDTGINYNHPNLAGSYIGGYDFVNNDNDPFDDGDHGTHVSGTIVSNHSIYRGVAPGAKIVAVKVCAGNGICEAGDIIAGMEWCVAHKTEYNISVISMSVADDGVYDSVEACHHILMDSALDLIESEGIYFVSAAGNDGPYGQGIGYPACYPSVIGVGAVDGSDHLLYNHGSLLRLLAPGQGIYSTCGNGFCEKSGTSMSTPHVAGAIALLLQAGVVDAEGLLFDTGVSVGDYSRIDVFNALNSLDDECLILLGHGEKLPAGITNVMQTNFSINYYSNKLDQIWFESNINGTYLNYSAIMLDNDSYYVEFDDKNFSEGQVFRWRFVGNSTCGNLGYSSWYESKMNSRPVLENISNGLIKGSPGDIKNYTVIASDIDGDALVFSDNSSLLDINETTGYFEVSINQSNLGTHLVNISVMDSKGLVDYQIVYFMFRENHTELNITDYNPKGDEIELLENSSQIFNITLQNETFVYVFWLLDGFLVETLNNGLELYADFDSADTEDLSQNLYNLTVMVSDGNITKSQGWDIEVINVNRPPKLLNEIENQNWNEDSQLVINLSRYFIDEDGSDLTYTFNDLENVSITTNRNLITLIPKPDWYGSAYLIINATDPEGASVISNNITLIVNDVAEPVAPSSGGGGGGGGGGGSSSSKPTITKITEDNVDEIVEEIMEEMEEEVVGESESVGNLGVGESVSFSIDNGEHSVTVDEVGDDYALITVRSEPIQLRLKVGESKNVDIDEDGKDDIVVGLESVRDGMVNLNIQEIGKRGLKLLSENRSGNLSQPSPLTGFGTVLVEYAKAEKISLGIIAGMLAVVISLIIWRRNLHAKLYQE